MADEQDGISLSNASTGLALGGPVGAAIGGGIGLAEFLIGMSQRKKANETFPQAISPEMEEAKSDFNRKRHNVFVGSAYNQQMADIKGMMAGGTAAMARTGSMGNMNYYMRNVAKLTNEMLAQGQEAETGYNKDYMDILNATDKTKRDLDMTKYAEGQARSTTNQKSGFSNVTDALQYLLPLLKKKTDLDNTSYNSTLNPEKNGVSTSSLNTGGLGDFIKNLMAQNKLLPNLGGETSGFNAGFPTLK